MKFLRYLLITLIALYLMVAGAAVYLFSHAERYQDDIQRLLAGYLNQEVQIGKLRTDWDGLNPGFIIADFQVVDPDTDQISAQFEHLAGRLRWYSLLWFWPHFTQLALEKPQLETSIQPDGRVVVAGKQFGSAGGGSKSRALLLTWLMSQGEINIHSGVFRWTRADQSAVIYQDVHASFSNHDKQRRFVASLGNDNGTLGVQLNIDGSPLTEQNWSASLNVIAGESDETLSRKPVELVVKDGAGKVTVPRLDAARLADIANVLARGSQFQRWLLVSRLKGEIEGLELTFSGSLLGIRDWNLSGVAHDLSWLSTHAAPGLDNVNARFQMGLAGGALQYKIDETKVRWPRVFPYPVVLDEARGRLSWRRKEGAIHLTSQQGVLRNADIDLQDVQVTYDKRGDSPGYLVAKADFKTQGVQRLERYFPKQTDVKFRSWWKNAFQRADQADGVISYIGETSQNAIRDGRAQISGNAVVDNVELNYGYQREWPVFKAPRVRVGLHNWQLSIAADQGIIGDSKVVDATAEIAKLNRPGRKLKLNAKLEGPLQHIVDFLQYGPLRRRPSDDMPDEIVAVAGGVYNADLALTIPFKIIRQTRVKGAARITGGELEVSGIKFDNVGGELKYTESTVSGRNLKADLLGGSLLADVTTLRAGQPPAVRISGAGDADINQLQQWLGPQLVSRMSGRTDWTGAVDISRSGVRVVVDSVLQGAEVDFPQPFAKTAEDTLPVSVELVTSALQRNTLRVGYGSDVVMQFQAENEQSNSFLDQGRIAIGKGRSSPLRAAEGIAIDVEREQIDLDAWIAAIQELSEVPVEKSSSPGFIDRLRQINLKTRQLALFDKQMGSTEAVAKSADGRAWSLSVAGENAVGTGQLQPFASPAAYNFQFARLRWPHTPNPKEKLQLEDLPEDTRRPDSFPSLNIQAEQFEALDKTLGAMKLVALPQGKRWKIEQFTLRQPGTTLAASGVWRPRPEESGFLTEIQMQLTSEAAGSALQDLGFAGFLEGGKAEFDADLQWPGSPMSFHMAKLDGRYKMDVRKARFPKVDASSGRLFGLLNVNSLSRRLRLDFQDVFGNGLVFDRMSSEGTVINGDILLRGFYIYGPSVYVQANGKVGLAKEDYDMELMVSPQLGGNIALLSALTNPAAGAVVFLAQRLFKKQFNQVIVYTYTVDGSWDKPNISRVVEDNTALVEDGR